MQSTTHRLEALAAQWRADAEKRRRMSANDVGADMLAYCADELMAEVTDTSEADEEISAAAYALLHGKSAKTVRRWCRDGLVLARQAGRDWKIRRGEPAPKLRRGDVAA